VIDLRSWKKGTVNQVTIREPEQNEADKHEAKTDSQKKIEFDQHQWSRCKHYSFW